MVEENQSNVDQMKKQYGAQLDYFELYQVSFGQDYHWWWVPTHPELRTNYFERVWTKQEIKAQRRAEKYETDEDDYDPDKKLFAQERIKARFEKRLIGVCVPLLFVVWMFVGQDFILKNLYSEEGHLKDFF